MKKRIEKIFSKIEKKPEIVLIRNSTDPFIDKNFYYYTGLVNGLFEDAVAILYPNGKIDLIISKLEEEIASKSDANLKIYKKQSEFYDILNVTIGSNNSIGLNFAGITHKDYCKFKNMFPKIDFF